MKYSGVMILSGLVLAILFCGCAPKLFWASHDKNIGEIDRLIAEGADINTTFLGHTILIEAALEGDIIMVKYLLQHGANPSILNTTDPIRPKTARQCAIDRGHTEVARLLQEAEERKYGIMSSSGTIAGNSTVALSSVRPMTLSVMDFKVSGGLTQSEMAMLADKLLNELVERGSYIVVERSNRDEILKEQGFQQSGVCDQGACLIEAGQLLGVQKMVGGTIGRLGSAYVVELRVMDVKTGEIDQGFSRQYSGDITVLLGAMHDAAVAFSDGTNTNFSPEKR